MKIYTRTVIEQLEVRRYLAGVTVICHGFESGIPGFYDDASWMDSMAQAVASKAGGADIWRATIGVLPGFIPYLASFNMQSSSPGAVVSDQTIIEVDWTAASDQLLTPINAGQIGDLIAPLLTKYPTTSHPFAELPIHLIGHSRGASVVTEIANDLGQEGIGVDQLTTLDPHPLTLLDPQNPVFLVPVIDPAVVVPDNVVYADNYFETDALIGPTGEPIDGTHETDLSSEGIGHSGVHTYYQGTIDRNATSDNDGGTIDPNWYGGDTRATTGFNYSLIDGGPRPTDGLSSLAGYSADRVPVSLATDQPWSNVTTLSATGADGATGIIQNGSPLDINYRYQDMDGNGYINFYLDNDTDPYNGSTYLAQTASLPLTGPLPGSAPGQLPITWDSSQFSPGIYHIYAAIYSPTGQTRYLYDTQPLYVTPNGVEIITKQWTGDVNSNWSDSRNWTPGGVPGWNDNVSIQLNASSHIDISSVTVTAADIELLSGQVNWLDSDFVPSSITVASGSVLNISAMNVGWAGTLNNYGTVNWLSAGGGLEGGESSNGSFQLQLVINNLAGGVFDIQGDSTVQFSGGYTQPVINNAGTFEKTGGTGTSDIRSFIFDNSGDVQVASGTLEVDGKINQTTGATVASSGGALSLQAFYLTGGALSGSGTINGSVNNSGGIVHPGSPTGALIINGNYIQSGTGQLQIELDGAPFTGAFGQLIVNGAVSVGGSIPLTLGYAPTHGDSFTVLSNDGSDSIGGTFNGLPEGSIVSFGGSYFRLSYVGGDGNDITLAAINPPPALSASGLGAIFSGDSYTLNLAYTDPNSDPNQSWSINWGDGSPVQVIAGNSTTAMHTFAGPSGGVPYSIEAWATNIDGPFSATPVAAAVYAAPLLNNGLLSLSGTTGNDSVSFTNSGGLLTLNLDGATAQYNSSVLTKVSYASSGGNDSINLTGAIPATLNLASGNSTVTNNDSAPVFVATGTGKTTINATAGTTIIPANAGTGIRQLDFAAINISSGAKVIFATSSSTLGDYSHHANRSVAVIDAGGLNIASGGILDMGDNDMILNYAAANEAATKTQVFNLLQSGITPGGDWSGTGMTSSEANYDSNFGIGARALGFMDNNDIQDSSFDGVALADFNQIIVKFTYYGDVDLSGTFDATDVNQLIAGRSHTPGDTGWEFCDLDYDGVTSTATDQTLFFAGRNAYQKFGAL